MNKSQKPLKILCLDMSLNKEVKVAEDLTLSHFYFFRKLDYELSSLPDTTLHGDRALMEGRDLVNQCQTNS